MLFLPYHVDLKDIDVEIYNYITTNLDKVIYMRIRELAEATHVSTTTILRFCKKFDCDGYSEFKLRLQLFAKEMNAHPTSVEVPDELTYIEFLKRTAQPDFQNQLDKAVGILQDVDLVLFAGIGSSGTIAEYGAMFFSSLFTLALHIEDPLNLPIYNLSERLDGKICLFALSVSGKNEDIISYINQLKMHHSKIISVTNSSNSTIAKISDVNLSYYMNKEMYQEANITSQLPAVYILETLARRVHKNQTSPQEAE